MNWTKEQAIRNALHKSNDRKSFIYDINNEIGIVRQDDELFITIGEKIYEHLRCPVCGHNIYAMFGKAVCKICGRVYKDKEA